MRWWTETDDTLENYAGILIEHALHDPSILETEGSLMSFYKFLPISEKEGRHYQEVFYDSTVYIELEDEDEPVRVMRTAFRMPDGQFYELTLMISILERDDMVEAMLLVLGGFVPASSGMYIRRYSVNTERSVPPIA